jgi:DNA-directed RNA polymerase subunit RPC12/RpoP
MTADDSWSECITCSEEFPPDRRALGYRTCRACGERRAEGERARKAKLCVPTHKSNYVYLGEGPNAVAYLRDITAMRRGNPN